MTKLTLKEQFKLNPYFFKSYLIVLIIGCIILIFTSKGDSVVYFNNWRGSLWDEVFIFFSSIGEGVYFAVLLLALGVYKFKYLVIGISSYLGTGAVSQIIKNMFKEPRPKIFFENSDIVKYVNGVDLYSWNSFPSGHSTTGFMIFLFLALITKNKKIGIVYLFCALLVGLSRVYLVQHFLIDVYFGSIIGVFFTIIIFNSFENSSKVVESKWYNYSLLSKLLKKQSKLE